MANKSLYDTYFGAGQSEGQYEASKIQVSDIWSDIDYSKQLTAQRGAQRERTLDTILAATEMASAVAGGMEAKQEWQGHLGRVEGELGEGQRIGRSGKAWKDTPFLEKLFSGKEYKFGSGESARVMGSADISVAGKTLEYGGEVNFDRFKPPSMAAEAQVSGDFYGERKGFDMGDIIGEKSVFAAGKEKLSSVLSPKESKPPPPPEPEKPKVKIESEEVDIADDVEVGDIDTSLETYKTWDPLEPYQRPKIGDTRPGQKTEPLINRVIGLGRDIGQNIGSLWGWNE